MTAKLPFCEPALDFETWLTVPPARMLVVLFARPWPADRTAEAYRAEILAACALVAKERRR